MVDGIVFLSLLVLLFIPGVFFSYTWMKVVHELPDPTPEKLWCTYWKKNIGPMCVMVGICMFVLAGIIHLFETGNDLEYSVLWTTHWLCLLLFLRAFSWKAFTSLEVETTTPDGGNPGKIEISS